MAMRFYLATLFALMLALPAAAQSSNYDEALYSALEYRSIGPFRGGRSAAVTGVAGKPLLFYFGSVGGGVWRTQDGGQSWSNISDGYFGGSIGAVAVSDWDPNVIYAGGGEVTVRGNVSHGHGMWKSTDAGKTWTDAGLKDSYHIPRIRIHPKNPDLVYAAVLGNLYRDTEERGVYRSKDGGATWERILFANAGAGAVDLVMDPTNPRILYASTWNVRRNPYNLSSGGEGSALWKSTDGGDTWSELSSKKGMPEGTLGIIGVAVSPVNPERVWAIVEADEGGVFRSDDGGETWKKINEDRNLRQRAWYYTRIYADTRDEDMVYVLNVQFWRSKDGGATYERIQTPHGDHHDLWIAPEDPSRMVIGDDGGAQVSFDAGANWSTYHNQPTAQFYRVTTDTHFPYRIYGAQQDNSTVRILSRSRGGSIGERDWEDTAGGESGFLAPHPLDPDIVYGGSYGGYLERLNHRTGESRDVNVWPDNPMGYGAEGMRFRFQWNFPIFFSPHDPNTLYTTANQVFKTTNDGQSWEAISPDLTRNDPSTLGPSGGPITKDNTSVEYYGTVFAAVESPHEAGVLWAGSDDGLIHVTRDGGATWQNVTPPARIMPEWILINSLEADPFEPGGLYVAATMYKHGDFRPYLYKTKDYGKTWTKIVAGIDEAHFTRVVRADPRRRGLLYAGTEVGMYLSFDDGAHWKPFQLNLPIVPITDLIVHENDLVVATQGRSFWVIDDLTPLHQLNETVAKADFWLYAPRPTYRLNGGGGGRPPQNAGANPPNGVMLRYYLREKPEDEAGVTLRILTRDGAIIRSYTSDAKEENERVPAAAGANQFVWNMRYPDAEGFDGLIMWAGSLTGPKAVPGRYQARLIAGADSMTVPFEILPDPRLSAPVADLQAKFDYIAESQQTLTETHQTIKSIREIRKQVEEIRDRVKGSDGEAAIEEAGDALLEQLKAIEETLYQTKNRSGQDPLNYPIRLNNKLAAVVGTVEQGEFRPTDQQVAVRDALTQQIEEQLERFEQLMEQALPAFNKLVRDQDVPAVVIEMKSAPPPGT
ncbi:MAG: glycosyl hydrolase [Rhodothermales bacterium]